VVITSELHAAAVAVLALGTLAICGDMTIDRLVPGGAEIVACDMDQCWLRWAVFDSKAVLQCDGDDS
jgi:hypothetical protein